MVQRVLSASSDFQLVVAASTGPEDDPLRELCRRIDVKCASGHPTDLLDRVFQIACEGRTDDVGLIPLSSPLIDPAVIDAVVQFQAEHDHAFDYVSNLHPASYPAGNDVELVTLAALETAWKEARKPYERTHITPYCWDNPDRFSIGNIRWTGGPDASMSHRWCVEFPEDYEFVRAAFDELWSVRRPVFPLRDILNLTLARPALAGINLHLAGVNWYFDHLHELRTIKESDTRISPLPEQQNRVL
jgi:spore coat polysaccharide biosynthesis protein SpsF